MAAKPIEKRVSDLEEIIDDIPRLINMRLSFMRAQLDALDARIGTVEAKVDKLDHRVSVVEAEIRGMRSEVQALPRVLAEMLDERSVGGSGRSALPAALSEIRGDHHGRSLHL
jgi:hypothetical protein